jgi:hypothetical protein
MRYPLPYLADEKLMLSVRVSRQDSPVTEAADFEHV